MTGIWKQTISFDFRETIVILYKGERQMWSEQCVLANVSSIPSSMELSCTLLAIQVNITECQAVLGCLLFAHIRSIFYTSICSGSVECCKE